MQIRIPGLGGLGVCMCNPLPGAPPLRFVDATKMLNCSCDDLLPNTPVRGQVCEYVHYYLNLALVSQHREWWRFPFLFFFFLVCVQFWWNRTHCTCSNKVSEADQLLALGPTPFPRVSPSHPQSEAHRFAGPSVHDHR